MPFVFRIAPYYRVSKDKKGGVSIDVQRAECERWIRAHADPRIRAARVLPAYIDDGKSAFTDDMAKRPAFGRLMTDAAARQFELVLVYKYDRFARKRAVYFRYIDELKDRYSIDVKSATESDDWLSVGFNGLMAEQYSRMLSARMKDVRAWEAKQGLHTGRVPVGYDRAKGVLTPNGEAEGIRQMGRLRATGQYSAVRLAEALNTAGYTIHGKSFKDTAVKEILRCPVYAGFITHNGQQYPGSHEPLWDRELWARIQEVDAERYQRHPREQKHFALLTGIARCAHCGGRLVHTTHYNTPSQRYYRCAVANRRMLSDAGLSCRARIVFADAVEAATLEWLHGLALLPDLLPAARALFEAPARPQGPSRADIETRMRRLARAYADGAYTDEEYAARRGDLLALLESASAVAPTIDIDAGMALIADLPTLLSEAGPEHRQHVVRQLISGVYLYRSEVRAIRPTRAAEVFFRAANADQWLTIVRNNARSASNQETHHSLKHAPLILAAA